MRLTILTLIILAAVNIASAQRYTLHSATKGVSILRGGKTTAAKTEMELKATDELLIPAGGAAEVRNAVDNCIYRSVRQGKITVLQLMVEARQAAADHVFVIGEKVDVVRLDDRDPKRVYNHKGMVVRSINRTCERKDTVSEETDTVSICTSRSMDK